MVGFSGLTIIRTGAATVVWTRRAFSAPTASTAPSMSTITTACTTLMAEARLEKFFQSTDRGGYKVQIVWLYKVVNSIELTAVKFCSRFDRRYFSLHHFLLGRKTNQNIGD